MSRRSNLNTVRRDWSWSSCWFSRHRYGELVLTDIKITEYLLGLFYIMRMPTSNYVIRRFFDELVLIEADIWFFSYKRLVSFIDTNYYMYFTLSRIRLWLNKDLKRRTRRGLVKDFRKIRMMLRRSYSCRRRYKLYFSSPMPNVLRMSIPAMSDTSAFVEIFSTPFYSYLRSTEELRHRLCMSMAHDMSRLYQYVAYSTPPQIV